MADWPRRLASEWLGSAALFATVVGSGIMAERLAAGNVAIALLGNTLATAAMLFVLITMLGPISGAHFNPAVTLAMRLDGRISSVEGLLYALVQIAGGVFGIIAAHAMFELPFMQLSQHGRGSGGEALGELIATFMLVLTIFGSLRYRPEQVPVAVALVITAGYWFTSSTSFANPAITLARSLTDSFSGIAFRDVPMFIVMQFIGATGAWLVSKWLFRPAQP